MAPVARERTGYPTQKPEALMGRLVEALTEPGDLVIDPYLGSYASYRNSDITSCATTPGPL